MISNKVRALLHKALTKQPTPEKREDSSHFLRWKKPTPKPAKPVKPSKTQSQSTLRVKKVDTVRTATNVTNTTNTITTTSTTNTVNSTPRQVPTARQVKWKTQPQSTPQPYTRSVHSFRVRSNVQTLLKKAMEEKQRQESACSIQKACEEAHTRITPIRPNGQVQRPLVVRTASIMKKDTPRVDPIPKRILEQRVHCVPAQAQVEDIQEYRRLEEEQQEDPSRLVYNINDCIYQSIVRTMIWYREGFNTMKPITTPFMRRQIDMISTRLPWAQWIAIQRELSTHPTAEYKHYSFTSSSYPCWGKWRDCVRRIENYRQGKGENKQIPMISRDTPTIQTMIQWTFDEFAMGGIVIPKLHIFSCLLIDSTAFLEWPILFGVKNHHVFPIINTSRYNDWITSPSVLESFFQQYTTKDKKNTLPSLSHLSETDKIMERTTRRYDFLIDKHIRHQYTLGQIVHELNQLDFVIVPFWSGNMMETLRRALYRIFQTSQAKKSSVFSKTWAMHLETLFAFYEREYLFWESV